MQNPLSIHAGQGLALEKGQFLHLKVSLSDFCFFFYITCACYVCSFIHKQGDVRRG